MPKIESAYGGVKVTFQRNNVNIPQSDTNVTSGVTSDVTSLSVAQLSERQRKICEMIKKDARISVKEMSLVLSLVERTVKRDLAAMQKMGVLVREGNTSAGRWVLLIKE